jgi:hypothetical protein
MSVIPASKIGNCGRKLWRSGACGNYQVLMFTNPKNETEKLRFGSTKDREKYYESKLKGKKGYSRFQRYSICVTPVLKNGSTCGAPVTRTPRRKSQRGKSQRRTTRRRSSKR